MEHACKEIPYCTCSLIADEPDENCFIHGIGPWPPRCHYCGRFVKRTDTGEENTITYSDTIQAKIIDAIETHLDWACEHNNGKLVADSLADTLLQIFDQEEK